MTVSLHEQGNAAFKAGDWLRAAALYSKGIKQAEALAVNDEQQLSVLYSNRSASLLKLNKVAKALADSEACIVLRPAWHKGHMRKALVLEEQGRLSEALACYQQAAVLCSPPSADLAFKVASLRKAINRRSSADAKIAKAQVQAQSKTSPSEQAALRFADAKLAYVRGLITEQGASFPPELHFVCTGSSSGSGSSDVATADAADGGAETAVRAEHAFSAPEVLAQFLAEMRLKAHELGATAAVLVAPKAAVAFPQTWQRQGWPHGAHDGVFVQLQAAVAPAPAAAAAGGRDQRQQQHGSSKVLLRRLWFIRLRPGRPPLEPEEVSTEFELLGPLIKV